MTVVCIGHNSTVSKVKELLQESQKVGSWEIKLVHVAFSLVKII